MKDIFYRCNLCQASVPPESLDSFLVGLYWSDFPVHGWVRKPAREVEVHVCQTCLKSLKIIAEAE